jgi:hypothetical protein
MSHPQQPNLSKLLRAIAIRLLLLIAVILGCFIIDRGATEDTLVAAGAHELAIGK